MTYRKTILCLLVLVVPLFFVEAFDLENGRAVAVFVSVVTLWFTGLVPLAVTGLLVPVLLAIFGIFPASTAFSQFGQQILFLFIGCFFLAEAMRKHGWDRRMSYWILSSRFGGRTPGSLITLIGVIAFVLSMWVSNTAAAAVLVPICIAIAGSFERQFSGEDQHRAFTTRALLTTAFSASIGGLATPVGTPPNLIALQLLEKNGHEVGFVRWMSIGLPVALLMFLALNVIMHFRLRVERIALTEVRSHFARELEELGPIRREEIQVASVFALAVFLWVVPGLLEMAFPGQSWIGVFADRFSMSVVGVSVPLLLFLLPTKQGVPNLEWQDARKIDWGTVLLFGGGLTLGHMLSATGLAETIGQMAFHPEWGVVVLVAGAVILGVIMSEFASNTASAAIIVPVLISVLGEPGFESVSMVLVVMACAFGASYGFMLPVSTPPNAIVYGTGRVDVRDMITTGILFDLSGAALIIGSTLLLNHLGVF